MGQTRCKFSEVDISQLFRDPAFPFAVLMRKVNYPGSSSLKGFGEAVIVGQPGSPTYTFGPNKNVLIVTFCP